MSPEDRAFQDELRAFLKTLPKTLTEKVRLARSLDRADYALWHGLLQERGWFAGPWPREFGGAGWTPMQRHIFDTETALAHAPRVLPFGITMLGPVLQKFGTRAQQDHYLPRILDQTDWWCQGYSEPGAGSDLASLKTRAERVGDEYIVNGQKTWTTLAHQSNWIFCLVRTDPAAARPQEGISFLLIDMASPGVTVRPIVLLDGSCEVNEVFFDDVRVPAGNLVGVENQGWTCAKYLLTHERTGITGIGFAMAALDAVRRMAAGQPAAQGSLLDSPAFALRLARTEIDLMALRTMNLGMLERAAAGQAPGVESSMLKVKGTLVRQAISDLMRRAIGPLAMAFPSEALEGANDMAPPGAPEAAAGLRLYLNTRKLSIYGGSNEIQRGIIAKTRLGL